MGSFVHVDEKALRVEMAKNGIIQIKDLADVSGVPRPTIDNMLSGRSTPNQRTIQAIYDALPVSAVQDLFAIFFDRDLRKTQGLPSTIGGDAIVQEEA